MKKLLIIFTFLLAPSLASAQCNGVFPNNTACGNITGSSNTPRPVPLSSFPTTTPGGTTGQIQYNNSGAFGGFTTSGDCTINTSTGVVSCPAFSFATFNAQIGNYPIATTDCGKTVTFSSGPFTATLPAASGFTAGCRVQVCNINPNTNGQRAVRLSGFPNPLFARLYMQQCTIVTNIASTAWQASYAPGRFHPAFTPNLLVDNGGSSANDGFVSNAAANALDSMATCFQILQVEYDLSANLQPICSPTGGQTLVGSFSIVGPLVGSSVINVTGNGGVAILQPTASAGFVLQLADFAPYMISTNVTWDCTSGSASCMDISFHQQTGADLNQGTTLKGNATGHIGVGCDSMCKINVGAAPLTVTGTFSYIATLDETSNLNINSGITITGSSNISGGMVNAAHGSNVTFAGALIAGTGISIGEIFTLRSGATGCMNANFTTSGSFGAARQWSVLNNAFFANPSANAIPGSTPGINTAATFAAGIVANSGLNSGGC